MGVATGVSLASGNGPAPPPPNPNPRNFRIMAVERFGRAMVTEVSYPGCTTYEGRKLLVFEGFTEAELRRLRFIDPHFTANANSPIARFHPNARGWKLARLTAVALGGIR